MTPLQLTLDRIDRILKRRGYSPTTPQERDLVEGLLEGGPCTDAYLCDAVCLARAYEERP